MRGAHRTWRHLPVMGRAAALIAVTAVMLGVVTPVAQPVTVTGPGGPDVGQAAAHDTSPSLRRLARTYSGSRRKAPPPTRAVPPDVVKRLADQPVAPIPPEAVEPAGPMPAPIQNFDGMANPSSYLPPDPNGAVGPAHYVQMVNVDLAVYDKEGNPLLGPVNSNVLWGGFGGACQNTNDGDPIAVYDGLADRWVLTQFSVDTHEYFECVAVSTTGDPLGSYYRYAFPYDGFNDYPKVGVWPDGYYATYNMYPDNEGDAVSPGGAGAVTERSAVTCALERRAMLVGKPATQQCFSEPDDWSMVPSDLDGSTPPPEGAPNYVLGLDGNDHLKLRRFSVDWDDPQRTTYSDPVLIPAQEVMPACLTVYRGRCVPQPGTAALLEALGGRLMLRAAYRNFGDHESLVVNQSVAMDGEPGLTSQIGTAWYEIRSPGGTPVVHQQGVSASQDPNEFRWMGSIAMDRQGNIALGYSSSSTTRFPSINYVGRLADDPLNTFPRTEGTAVAGTGSQLAFGSRWGDYTSLQIDPLDDCTFWYTNEYLPETSFAGWVARATSFRFPGCHGSASVPGSPDPVRGTGRNRSIRLSWSPPADTGDLPITRYTVTSTPGGRTCDRVVGSAADPLSCTFVGLDNGTPYEFRVRAHNALGAGPASTASATPATVPTAPRTARATPGDRAASVSWQAPADDGGAPVTGYTVTATPGGRTCVGTAGARSCTVSGLTNGIPYTFTVRASNSRGTGPITGPTVPVTPTGRAVLGVIAHPASGLRPLQPTRIEVTGAGAGCPVTVRLRGSSRVVTADAAGRVTVRVPAPPRPGTFAVRASQGGPLCELRVARTSVTVAVAEISGPRRAPAADRVRFTGHGFPAHRTVTWQVRSHGSPLGHTRARTSARGTTVWRLRLPAPGRNHIVARWHRVTAHIEVDRYGRRQGLG